MRSSDGSNSEKFPVYASVYIAFGVGQLIVLGLSWFFYVNFVVHANRTIHSKVSPNSLFRGVCCVCWCLCVCLLVFVCALPTLKKIEAHSNKRHNNQKPRRSNRGGNDDSTNKKPKIDHCLKRLW